VFVIGWSTQPVFVATVICLVLFALLYIPLSRRKYLLPDPAVRSGEFVQVRERHDDPGER
jgi:hypothetical protein